MNWNTILYWALALGALSALSYALTALASWAKAKAKESNLARVLSTLPVLVEVVYKDVYSQVKDEIDAATADGKLTNEELAKIRDEALAALKESLSKNGLNTLKDAFGPLLDLVLGKLVGQAEAQVTGQTQPSPQ